MAVYQDSSVKLLHEDTPISIRSVRISVSTPDFHSGKMSSTLIQTTVADFAISDIK